jgi:hypothetical protein
MLFYRRVCQEEITLRNDGSLLMAWKSCCNHHCPNTVVIMVITIPIHILVSYDFTILLRLIDTYRDGILIWVVSYSYPDMYHDIFSIPI